MPIEWPQPAQHSSADSGVDSDSSSLPSYPSSEASFDSNDQAALIQEEWEESLRQIEAVLSVVILPFFGKWYGRKVAFWGELSSRFGPRAAESEAPIVVLEVELRATSTACVPRPKLR